jgi:hypothetical protein
MFVIAFGILGATAWLFSVAEGWIAGRRARRADA